MSSDFFNGLYIIPILAVLILIHEIGHFVTARMCGVKVEEFGIGIPPRIFGWTRNGVIWSINAIPFGGFVRVKGEDGKNVEPDSMNAKPPHQRAFFLAAGSAMNVLLAIVLMVIVVGIQGVPHSNSYIADVVPQSPAAKAGWQRGDRIVRINGDRVETTDEVATSTRSHAGDEITVTVERRGKFVDTILIPREDPPEGQGAVGVSLLQRNESNLFVEAVQPGSAAESAGLIAGDRIMSINERPILDSYVFQTELTRFEGFAVPVTYERNGEVVETDIAVPNLGQGDDVFLAIGTSTLKVKAVYESVPASRVVPRGFEEAYDTTVQMIRGIKELFSDTENLKQVAGPIGMGQLTSELIDESTLPLWVTISQIMIVLSLNLALLNLLPLPALDGGRLFFVLIEVLRGGRRIAPEKEGLVHFAGLVILLGAMFVVAFLDVDRIRDGVSFLE